MLSPIPRRILRDELTLSVPGGFDRYQQPIDPTEYVVSNVHIQNNNETRRTATNTEVVLRAVLFVDARYSTPQLDFWALQTQTQESGGVMTCTVKDRRGGVSGPYTVLVVDGLPDDEGNLHHWELGLV
jgi:hypothetical protein